MKTTLVKDSIAVLEYLEGLDNEDLVDLWNIFARESYPDDEIYDNDEEFFELFYQKEPMSAIRAIFYGDYRYPDKFVKFDGYANLESFDNSESHVDFDLLVEDILENPDNYDIELEEEE